MAYFASQEFKVDLVELPRGEVPATTPGNHYTYIRALAFSPDGVTLAAGAGDRARLWDTATGQQKESLASMPTSLFAADFQSALDQARATSGKPGGPSPRANASEL